MAINIKVIQIKLCLHQQIKGCQNCQNISNCQHFGNYFCQNVGKLHVLIYLWFFDSSRDSNTSRRDRMLIAQRFIGGEQGTRIMSSRRDVRRDQALGRTSLRDGNSRRVVSPGMNSWASGALSLRDEKTSRLSISRELSKNHICKDRDRNNFPKTCR